MSSQSPRPPNDCYPDHVTAPAFERGCFTATMHIRPIRSKHARVNQKQARVIRPIRSKHVSFVQSEASTCHLLDLARLSDWISSLSNRPEVVSTLSV